MQTPQMTPRSARRLKWGVPLGACVITGGIIAGSLISVAQASPPLPPRTPAQLLADVAGKPSPPPPFDGTVVETASLGLPSLPGMSGSSSSPSSLLTGSHTVRVYYADPQHLRLAMPGQLSETDLIRNGRSAWVWDSTQNQVTHYQLPARSANDSPPAPTPQRTPLTPQQAAQQVLAAVGPTTNVSVARNVTVAGESAYELVLAPKDSRSLIGQVRIAVDGQRDVPLRVQVFGRNSAAPAFQTGFTSVSFTRPAAANFSFSPPQHAKVVQGNVNSGNGASESGSRPDMIGKGWLAVAVMPSATPPSPGKAGSAPGNRADQSARTTQALLNAATPVHGTWGSGRLLRTTLFSALLTSDGRLLAGAVTPDVLYSAVSQAR